jgi:hypothetical protein
MELMKCAHEATSDHQAIYIDILEQFKRLTIYLRNAQLSNQN